MLRKVLELPLPGARLVVIAGDITQEQTDAIVNAANSSLAHGGGVAGAIVRKGGWEIQEASRKLAPVPVGNAVVTGAGQLPCRWVIHAVGPVWGEGEEEMKLRSAVRSALARAEEMRLKSVALPAISTGIFGYPKEAGCRVIAQECLAHLRKTGSVREIHLVALDEETVSAFSQACKELEDPLPPEGHHS
ncbi:MAG: macro domain-containing protein [Thermoanaerobaculaceae bacterium]